MGQMISHHTNSSANGANTHHHDQLATGPNSDKPCVTFDCEGIAGQVGGGQCEAVGQCPLPALQTLARKSIHHIEIDVGKSGGSGMCHSCDGFTDGAGPSNSGELVIIHRFSAETHAGDAGLIERCKILFGDGGRVCFDGDFAV